MRVSADKNDPGYINFKPNMRVFIQGIERIGVITVDEEKRCALIYQLDENGRIAIRDDNEWVTEWFYGDVWVEET